MKRDDPNHVNPRSLTHRALRLCFAEGCLKEALPERNFCEDHLPVPPANFNPRMVAGR